MAYLLETDLAKLLHQDRIDEIKRDDATKVPEAIDAAIGEAKSLMSRYDLLQIFGNNETAPTITDANLKRQVAKIACYNLVQISNSGVNIEEYRLYYEDAIMWLNKVASGKADPEGWPKKSDNAEDGTSPGDRITWSSHPKRNDRY